MPGALDKILGLDKRRAVELAQKVGPARARKLLERAEEELEKRLAKLRIPADQTFTGQQAKLVLEQVRDVLRPLGQAMTGVITDLSRVAAEGASSSLIEYANAAEAKYRGVAQPLALREASMLDRAARASESSVLNRIRSDPQHPGHKGVLERYDDGVVESFEQELQLRFISKKPWGETREALVAASPFLQGKPAYWSERLIRNEIMQAHNASSFSTIQELGEELGDMLKILSSTFDNRTGADSIAVHGQVRRVSERFDTWYGPVMHPPDRPNDRAVVVPHRMSWPIPAELKPRSAGEVSARWRAEGRKGSHPPIPRDSTVDRSLIGKTPPPKQPAPLPPPPKSEPARGEPLSAAPIWKVTREDPSQPPRVVRVNDEGGVLRGIAAEALPVVESILAKPERFAHGLSTHHADPSSHEQAAKKHGGLAKLLETHGEQVTLPGHVVSQIAFAQREVVRDEVAAFVAEVHHSDRFLPVVVKHSGKYVVHSGAEVMAAEAATREHQVQQDVAKQKAKGILRFEKTEAEDIERVTATLREFASRVPQSVRLIDLDKLEVQKPVSPADLGRALKKRDKGAVRDAMRGELGKLGIVTRDDRISDRFGGRSSISLKTQERHIEFKRMPRGVAAQHDWNGVVLVPKKSFDAFADDIARVNEPGFEAKPLHWRRALLDKVHVMVHEEAHGASAAVGTAYKGVGVGIEEALTEIIARKATREFVPGAGDTYPLPKWQRTESLFASAGEEGFSGGHGAYENFIKGLISETAKATGDKTTAHEVVERAAIETRKWDPHKKWVKPEDQIRAYVDALKLDKSKADALYARLADPKGPLMPR